MIEITKNCRECGKGFKIRPSHAHKRFTCSNICRGKQHSKYLVLNHPNTGRVFPQMREENHYRWVKDRTKLAPTRNQRGDSSEAKIWRRKILDRDSEKCKIANQDCFGRIEVHHILRVRDYPELRYDINNGITLCHAHHPHGREKEQRLAPFLQSLVTNTH